MHKLEIKNREVFLDGFKLNGVTGYELKSSAELPLAELTIKLTTVEDSHLVLEKKAIAATAAIQVNLDGKELGKQVIDKVNCLQSTRQPHAGSMSL